jgi:hypothetical protein
MRVTRVLLLGLAIPGLAGCAKAQAKAALPPPALVTPAPPEHVIEPVPIPEPTEAAAPEAPAAVPSAPARPRETPRPTERATVPAVPAAPAPEPSAIAPPPVLQTTSNPAEVEQRARGLIGAAQRDLDQINPARLSANARTQYDTARAFIRQAEDALKAKNVVLARELADKAASLASQLRR